MPRFPLLAVPACAIATLLAAWLSSSALGCLSSSASPAPDPLAALDAAPVPDGGYPSCDDSSSPETGPCCEHLVCVAAQPDGTCATSEQQTKNDLGSEQFGMCRCGAFTGPFRATSADAGEPCCYVVPRQHCL
jgi:hypothetical protein